MPQVSHTDVHSQVRYWRHLEATSNSILNRIYTFITAPTQEVLSSSIEGSASAQHGGQSTAILGLGGSLGKLRRPYTNIHLPAKHAPSARMRLQNSLLGRRFTVTHYARSHPGPYPVGQRNSMVYACAPARACRSGPRHPQATLPSPLRTHDVSATACCQARSAANKKRKHKGRGPNTCSTFE